MEYQAEAISLKNKRQMDKVIRLLNQEGIRLDGNLDYTCGVYDEDDNVIATGSCYQNTLRCMAVSSEHQGEGLLNLVITHLMDFQASRGNYHLFVYTKAKSAKFFKDLGFYEIAMVDQKLSFLENRKDGFPEYLRKLERSKKDGSQAAIVMNANPFTLGHRALVEKASRENDWVHVFVLQEENGPIPAAVRWKLVEEGTADLSNVILHPSGDYIISSATFPSYFLKDGDDVVKTHAALDIAVFAQIAQALGIGRRYAGEEPFSHTTALYNGVMAEMLPQYGTELCVIPRAAADDGTVISASAVRQAIHDGKLEDVRNFLPRTTYAYFAGPEGQATVEAICRAQGLIHH